MSDMADAVTKKDLLLKAIQDSWIRLFVHPWVPGVKLPAYILSQKLCALDIGHDMPRPITDLVIDDAGIRCTLIFQNVPFAIEIPWLALHAFERDTDKLAYIFDPTPQELANLETASVSTSDPKPTRKARPPWLKLV